MNGKKTYQEELAEWKARHGLAEVDESNRHEMRMAAEESQAKGKSWCFGCDKHLPIREMKLITRAIDAYVQYDEGESDYIAKSFRVRMCAECFKENYESLTETKAENNNQSGTPTAEEKGN